MWWLGKMFAFHLLPRLYQLITCHTNHLSCLLQRAQNNGTNGCGIDWEINLTFVTRGALRYCAPYCPVWMHQRHWQHCAYLGIHHCHVVRFTLDPRNCVGFVRATWRGAASVMWSYFTNGSPSNAAVWWYWAGCKGCPSGSQPFGIL